MKTVNIEEPVVVNSSFDIPYIKESIKRNRNNVPNNIIVLLKYLLFKCFSNIKIQ
tara:strand:+ start:599 stop:763 length:165 start_codon:yes stop_codon:yes gene_type:complete